MKKLILLIPFLLFFKGHAQKTPILNVGKKQLTLAKLEVKTKIVGTIAVTTYDMYFHNATNRVLEGELKFPLAENQEIVRLALEMNGKLREGVVVEKELGRIAFEGIVRRGVDPSLLEKGKGNTYKVRVYPIAAKSYKRVVIAYEQELLYKDNAHFYHLPLHFKENLENFNVTIEVVNQDKKPLLVKGEEIMQFSNWQNSYKTTFSKEKYTPNKSILIKIPIAVKGEKLVASPNYFYFYKTLNPTVKKRKEPNSISLFWDVSLSMKSRNIEKEINLLNEYFKTIKNSIVYFIPFSNEALAKEKIEIKNGNWEILKNKLLKSTYDGGTSFSTIQALKIKSDIVLLSSDGMTTLSETELFKEKPVFIINSKTEANHKQLNHIAKKTKGAYINLNRSSTKEGLKSLTTVPFEYLGFSAKRKNIEIYPSFSSKLLFDFSVTGKNYSNGEKITFFFGYGNTITREIPVTIQADQHTKDDAIKRIWAKNKLNELTKNQKENKKQIIELATKYSLVTNYTSLIVLEEVEDYIRYNITPPEELLEAYHRIKNNNSIKKGRITNNFNSSLPPAPVSKRMEIVENDNVVKEVLIEPTEINENEEVSEIEEIIEVEESEEEIVEDIPFSIVEKVPVFIGCNENYTNDNLKNCLNKKIKEHIVENLNKNLANNLGLPVGKKRLLSKFTIDKNGNIVNIQIRAPHRILANEVIRVLQLLPKFKPATQRGKRVNVNYVLPVTFVVEENTTKTTNSNWVTVKANTVENTHNSRYNQRNFSKPLPYKKYKESLEITKRTVKTPYLTALNFFKDKESAYSFYLTQRESYQEVPHYYIDVSDYFLQKFKSKKYANKILSNIAELDADNYELLKAYAYKLQERNENNLALFTYKKILELRPEDAQSYRDLALAYQEEKSYQKAFDLFLDIVTKKIYQKNKYRRVFQGLQDITEEELKQLYLSSKDSLDKTKIPKELLSEIEPIDLRVVVDWNHNDTDIDLHIIDPNLEECYYKHSKTIQGGKLSKDMTQGFGPESFILKNAKKGSYYVKIKYFGDRKQKIEAPTFMKITTFKNQGKRNEEKTIQVIRLTKNDEEEIVQKIKI